MSRLEDDLAAIKKLVLFEVTEMGEVVRLQLKPREMLVQPWLPENGRRQLFLPLTTIRLAVSWALLRGLFPSCSCHC